MQDKSLQVSMDDLQQIQIHLEGQEQALAAIAEHLRAFESDAEQFTHFQRDFIKTIGLIQDVHQYTKQQAQHWSEQLEQCTTVYQNIFRLQTEIAPQITASTDHFSNQLQTTLQQQKHYFEKLQSVMIEHENLLFKHQSIELFKEIPDLIHQISQRLNNALTQVDTVFVGLSNLEDQHLRHSKQLFATMEKQFADRQSLLIRQYAERDQQLDQRFSDLSNIVEQNLEQFRQDQNNHQRFLKAVCLIFFALVLLIFLTLFAYEHMQKKQEVLHPKPLPVLEKKVISATQSGSQPEQKVISATQSRSQLEQKVISATQSGSQDVWIDRKNNLMWLNCGLGQTWQAGRCNGDLTTYTWSEAQAWVSAINQNGSYAGYNDWRLPSLAQYFTRALCRSGYTRSIKIPSQELGFLTVKGDCRQHAAPYVFWSDTVSSNSPSFAYTIDYGSATAQLSSKDSRYFLTLVRNP